METNFIKKKNEYFPKWLLFTFLVSADFWDPVGLSLITSKYLETFVLVLLLFYMLEKKIFFSNVVANDFSILLIPLFSLCSVFSCYFLHGQPISISLMVYRVQIIWLVYFVLCYKKVSLNTMYSLISIIVFVYVLISLIQQFTFPFAPFGLRSIGSVYSNSFFDGMVEKRFGMYRFDVGGSLFLLPFFSLWVWKYKRFHFFKVKFMFGVLILGVLLSCTRQLIFQFFFALFLFYLLNKGSKYRYVHVFLFLVLFFLIFKYGALWFGDLANLGDDFDNSRSVSWDYYCKEYFSSISSVLFGNGIPHDTSSYGIFANSLYDEHIIIADVGILGSLYNYGLIFFLVFFSVVLHFLFNKNLDLAFKVVLFSLAFSPSLYLFSFSSFFVFSVFFYICRLNILENKMKVIYNFY